MFFLEQSENGGAEAPGCEVTLGHIIMDTFGTESIPNRHKYV